MLDFGGGVKYFFGAFVGFPTYDETLIFDDFWWECSFIAGYTPWKINGWNLQITHLERKNDLNQIPMRTCSSR